MEMKTCPDCSERVRAGARKCQFCCFRFDAPKPSRMPRALLVIGLVVAIVGAVVASIGVVVGIAIAAIGGVATAAQQKQRRARRFIATGEHARLVPAVTPLAIFTTLRGY